MSPYEVTNMTRELLLMTAVALALAGCATAPQTANDAPYSDSNYTAVQLGLMGPRGATGATGQTGNRA